MTARRPLDLVRTPGGLEGRFQGGSCDAHRLRAGSRSISAGQNGLTPGQRMKPWEKGHLLLAVRVDLDRKRARL